MLQQEVVTISAEDKQNITGALGTLTVTVGTDGLCGTAGPGIWEIWAHRGRVALGRGQRQNGTRQEGKWASGLTMTPGSNRSLIQRDAETPWRASIQLNFTFASTLWLSTVLHLPGWASEAFFVKGDRNTSSQGIQG